MIQWDQRDGLTDEQIEALEALDRREKEQAGWSDTLFSAWIAAMIALLLLGGMALRGAEAGECRVTGFVISIRPETKAQPQENQFRMLVVTSPWSWQVGTSRPVTSETPHGLQPGDPVEVFCDFARYTRRGRFWGTARKMGLMRDHTLSEQKQLLDRFLEALAESKAREIGPTAPAAPTAREGTRQ